MIVVTINGEDYRFEGEMNVASILALLDIRGATIAVALNMEVVPKSEHGQTIVHHGDRIEIIRPVQGG
ncbi:MAG: sulfur carrier protein ThiS [Candidatus Latescibacteria bacterium]|nr:sulfur carrier protein ThiS [Candidatus Latescibacterota bacterium]